MREVPYIRAVEPAGDFELLVSFGDGSQGIWRAPVEGWKGPMAEPLKDPIFLQPLSAKKGRLFGKMAMTQVRMLFGKTSKLAVD